MFITPCRLGLSPLEVALRLRGEPGLAWLDGGLTHGQEGRYSFVAASPVSWVERPVSTPDAIGALDELAEQDRCSRAPNPTASHDCALAPEDIPSWIGHIAYDALSPALPAQQKGRRSAEPCLQFARYDALFAFDHERDVGFLVGDSQESCRSLEGRLHHLPSNVHPSLDFVAELSEVSAPEAHVQRVRAALEGIYAGNVYEVNLARRYRATFRGSPLGLFLRMREQSPVPFGFYMQAPEQSVLGRSMERFLRYRVRDRSLWTSPIKGTVAHTGDSRKEAQALKDDPKEHAEHAMVVDLMRNDLSRVSEPGSVEVRELMQVLPFAGLSHLVSTVRGRALPNLGLSAILRGTFPPGSVTGAPKESAMRTIAALEENARGIYTGAQGFVDRAGGISLSVAIRTAVVHEGMVDYFAGGGIVVGSDPESETRETDLKAQVFLRAIATRS